MLGCQSIAGPNQPAICSVNDSWHSARLPSSSVCSVIKTCGRLGQQHCILQRKGTQKISMNREHEKKMKEEAGTRDSTTGTYVQMTVKICRHTCESGSNEPRVSTNLFKDMPVEAHLQSDQWRWLEQLVSALAFNGSNLERRDNELFFLRCRFDLFFATHAKATTLSCTDTLVEMKLYPGAPNVCQIKRQRQERRMTAGV